MYLRVLPEIFSCQGLNQELLCFEASSPAFPLVLLWEMTLTSLGSTGKNWAHHCLAHSIGESTQEQGFVVVKVCQACFRAVLFLFAVIILLVFAIWYLHLPICDVLRVRKKRGIREWVDFTSPRKPRDLKLVKNLSV